MSVRNDDERRFTELHRRHYVDVLRFVRRRLDAETTGDVVAETFLVAWRRLEEVPADPLPWLYGVARNAVANRRRSTGRQDRLQQRVLDPAAGASCTSPTMRSRRRSPFGLPLPSPSCPPRTKRPSASSPGSD